MDVEQKIQPAVECARLLKRKNIRGEFYITGRMMEKFPSQCREISRYHIIGGHGYNHENFAKLRKKKQRQLIKKTIAIFKKHHVDIQGWRFPGVNFTSESLQLITKAGLFDSSIRKTVWKKWGSYDFVRNWLKNIKNGIFSPLLPYPTNLREKPWSHADTEDKNFYKKSGRVMMHCWKFHEYKKELEAYL